MSERIALLGDSIFDNASYTQGEPDVITHLRQLLPRGYDATLLAIDGSTTGDLKDQLAKLPSGISRVVISIGGNDALLNADILNLPVASTQEAFQLFAERISKFEENYRGAVSDVVGRGVRTIVCTIYNGNFPEVEAPSARMALMMFNDVILRVAFELQLDVIDLRLICNEPSDYANPIEPSGKGGGKIARAIATSLGLEAKDSKKVSVFSS